MHVLSGPEGRRRIEYAWSRARRPLSIALKIAAAVALVYELGMNALLMSGGLARLLSQDPDVMLIDYASGWSILPGVVHARELRIRSKDGHVEFDLHIDRCVFRVALLDLLRKRFHVRWVHGVGVTFRMRLRMDPKEATPDVVEALPPIDGLEPIPLLGPEDPPPDDAHYNLITFQLDDVNAEAVREIWCATLHYEGDAHIVGKFYLRPIRWASVGPATVDTKAGRVSVGTDRLLEGLTGRIETTVDGFDPRVTNGPELLHHISVRAVVAADVPGLGFVHRVLHAPGVHIAGGTGHLKMDAGVDHGRIAPGGRASAELPGVDIELAKGSVTGNVFVSASTSSPSTVVSASTSPPSHTATVTSLEGAVTVRDVRIATRGFEPNPVRIDRADVAIATSELDLAVHPFSDAELSATLPTAQIADARVVDPWLDEGGNVRVQGGHGALGADVVLARGTARGTALLALEGAEVAMGRKESFTGELRLRARLNRWNIAAGRMDLSGTRVEVLHVAATGGTADWWANVELPASEVDLRAGPVWRAHVLVQARDTRPFAGAIVAQENLPQWLTPLATSGDVHASAQIQVGFGDGAIDVRDLSATAGPFRVNATFAKHAEQSDLLALVSTGIVSVGIESNDGRTHFELAGADAWYAQRAHSSPRASP